MPLGDEWSKRWLKHEVVDPAQWERAHAIIQSLPSPSEPMVLPPTSPEEWRRVVQSRPSRTATGLDGASRQMLLDMPRDLVCYILEVHDFAEETGQWPVQAMDAVVATRQALRFLAAQAPDTLLGMLPHWSAFKSGMLCNSR